MPDKKDTTDKKPKDVKRRNPVFHEKWNEGLISQMSLALFEKKVRHFGSSETHPFPDDITKEEIKEAHNHFKNIKKKG